MNDVQDYFESIKPAVDARLYAFLLKKRSNLLTKAIRYTARSGGKRIRPALFCYAYAMYKKPNKNIYDIAAAIELFQTSALIHDDIMDHSAHRRGKKTIVELYGENRAILAGDVCLSYANELFSTSLDALDLKKTACLAVVRKWHKMQEDVMHGQLLDVSLDIQDVLDADKSVFPKLLRRMEKVMQYKTAEYSIVAPLVLGGLVGGASDSALQLFSRYGMAIGTAFQLKDDYLGVFGNSGALGKSTALDVQEGKVTWMLVRFIQTLPKEKRTEDTIRNVRFVRSHMRENGIDKIVDRKIDGLTHMAIEAINTSSLQSSHKKFFAKFAHFVAGRKS